MAGVKIELSGVESHNSLSAGEKYHDPLRRIYEKILFDNPSMKPDFILSTAVKAMNDTMNCDGLVPSLLVFGVLPRFPSFRTALPNQTERMRALSAARTEMETITSELRLSKALLAALPAATKQVFKPGQEVLVFREKERVRWTGPYKITKIHGKQAFIDRDGTEVQHSISQLKPYIRDSEEQSELYCSILHNCFSQFTSGDKQEDRPEVLYSTNPDQTDYATPGIFLTETLHPADSRRDSPEFIKAKQKEMKGLIDRGTWKAVLRKDLPHDANILSGRYVLTIKNVEN